MLLFIHLRLENNTAVELPSNVRLYIKIIQFDKVVYVYFSMFTPLPLTSYLSAMRILLKINVCITEILYLARLLLVSTTTTKTK